MTYGLYHTEKDRWVTLDGRVLEFYGVRAAKAQREALPESDQIEIRPFKPTDFED